MLNFPESFVTVVTNIYYIPKIIKQLTDKRADLNRVTRMYNEATITRQLRKGYAKVNGDVMQAIRLLQSVLQPLQTKPPK